MWLLPLSLMAAGGCGPGSNAPPDGGPPLGLDVMTPPGPQIGVHYGKSIDLRVRYHEDTPASAPVAGGSCASRSSAIPAGSTLSRDLVQTDANGVATVTLTGGQAEKSFKVAATAVNAPEVLFDVSVSMFAFVEMDASLTWPTAVKLRALLYDDKSCAELPASSSLPSPSRAVSRRRT